MSYIATDNLDIFDASRPVNSETVSILGDAVRETRRVLKNLFLIAHEVDGSLKPIETASIAPSAITEEKLANDSVTPVKVKKAVFDATIFTPKAITEATLADSCLTERLFTVDSIPATAFKVNSIAAANLIGEIPGSKIQNSQIDDSVRAISNEHLKDLAVKDRNVETLSFAKIRGLSEGFIMVGSGSTPVQVKLSGPVTLNPDGSTVLENQHKYVVFGDQKQRGTDGGVHASSGTFVMRSLQELYDDSVDIIAFSGNEFALIEGTYFFYARVPACGVGRHQARLLSVQPEGNAVLLWGSSAFAPLVRDSAGTGTTPVQSDSIISGVISVASNTWLQRIEHYVENAGQSYDLGRSVSSTNVPPYINHVEQYTHGWLIKIA